MAGESRRIFHTCTKVLWLQGCLPSDLQSVKAKPLLETIVPRLLRHFQRKTILVPAVGGLTEIWVHLRTCVEDQSNRPIPIDYRRRSFSNHTSVWAMCNSCREPLIWHSCIIRQCRGQGTELNGPVGNGIIKPTSLRLWGSWILN